MSRILQSVEAGRPGSRRPLGVWLLTIYDGLNAGLLPLVLMAIILRQSPGLLSLVDVLWSTILALGILVAAVAAWSGRNIGRLALVVLLAVHYGALALNNALVVISPVPHSDPALSSMRVLRSLFWIGINCWYFLGSRPRAFFGLSSPAPAAQPSVSRQATIPDQKNGNASLCPRCGHLTDIGDIFCGKCGTRLQA